MRFTVPMFLLLSLFLSESVYSQGITLNEKDCSLKVIIVKVERQTGYTFAYRLELFRMAKMVTIQVKNASLGQVLVICEKGQPFVFEVNNKIKTIFLKERQGPAIDRPEATSPLISITGKVVNERDEPLEAVTVKIGAMSRSLITNSKGYFMLNDIDSMATLLVTSVGYEDKSVEVNGRRHLLIKLKVSRQLLDEVVFVPYGKTLNRLKTASINKIKGDQIENFGWSNPLISIAGRVPGLSITQSSGLPGASNGIQIRGLSSIGLYSSSTRNNPLIVIDGVPFATSNNSIQAVPAGTLFGTQGRSPFPIINLHDILSIEVLKDADATSIYGSRGGNGAILITTKRGIVSKPQVFMSLYAGISKVSRKTGMMNTQQYAEMRNEALKNDNLVADSSNAADLKIWGTDRYTDFNKLLIGGTGKVTDGQITISGGTPGATYRVGVNNHQETTVYPSEIGDKRRSFHFSMGNYFLKRKLASDLAVSYSNGESRLISTDLTQSISLPPNVPELYNSFNQLNWGQPGAYFDNPKSYLEHKYISTLESLLLSCKVTFNITKHVSLKAITGQNSVWLDERIIKPGKSLNPFISLNPTGSAYFGKNTYKIWIFEPHLQYIANIPKGTVTVLIGGSGQQLVNKSTTIVADGYTNDARLLDTTNAQKVTLVNNKTDYKYHGLFGRINFNWKNRYVLNISGRREGSTRFGRAENYGNFRAIGAAWIFSEESFVKNKVPILSFGKLRGSFGVTGNDQIGDYGYLDKWSRATVIYQGVTPVFPTAISDPRYSWETIRKSEGAIELGFFKDRLFFMAGYYDNRTSNQLISYELPFATGFNYIAVTNWPAIVRNSGFEFSVRFKGKDVSTSKVSWSCEANLTIPRNKLLSFPGLANSKYRFALVEGQSLTVQRGYVYQGVDSDSGYFKFKDINNDGRLDTADYAISGNLDPQLYGGMTNTLSYKNWSLQIFIEGRRQSGHSFPYKIYNSTQPGTPRMNQPVAVLNRWQKPNDQSTFQKYSTGKDHKADVAINRFLNSNGRFTYASFIRLKTFTFSYTLPRKLLTALRMMSGCVYAQAYNLITISPYKELDPETQSLYVLPPLRTIAFGFQCSF